ncbi:MAG: hypothetical protein QOE70_2991 [Chthoniobacter sp.]|jgi:hypothetical protein|nr:hypothetical protein [Chthoniobacter sp.]
MSRAQLGPGSFGQDARTSGRDATVPGTCLLTFQRGDSVDSPWETCELPVINPALSVGHVTLTAAFFGITARQIGALTIGGAKQALANAANNLALAPYFRVVDFA